jgi:hypothetical protein
MKPERKQVAQGKVEKRDSSFSHAPARKSSPTAPISLQDKIRRRGWDPGQSAVLGFLYEILIPAQSLSKINEI